MTKKQEGLCAAIIVGVVAGSIVIASASSLPGVAVPSSNGAAKATGNAVTAKSAKKPAAKSATESAANASQKASTSVNLSKIDQAKAILAELQVLDHPEQKIRMGSPGWQEERQAAAASSQQHIHDAQSKLSSLGSSIAPVLAEGLNSSNRDVTESCIKVLAQYGRDSVAPILITIVKYGVIPNAVSTLRQIGSDSIPLLIVMLKSSDKNESFTALTVLDGILPVQNSYRSFPRAFMGSAFNSAINENVVFTGPQVEQICSLQTNDASIKFKQVLADLLGKIGPRSPQVAARLATLISNEEQPEVRQAAISALGNVVAHQNQETASEFADILLKSLTKDDYAGCRVEAATAIGRIPSAASKSVPALAQALKDGYPEVANASVGALTSLGDKASGALPELLKFAHDSPDVNAQAQAMTAIVSMRSAALPALPFILKCLSEDNFQLKNGALNVVASLGPAASSAVPQLIPMLSDSQMRLNAVHALGAIGPAASAAVPALKELAQSNQTDRLNARQAVQQALQKITGQSQDSSASSDGLQNNVTRSIAPPPSLRIQSRNASSI